MIKNGTELVFSKQKLPRRSEAQGLSKRGPGLPALAKPARAPALGLRLPGFEVPFLRDLGLLPFLPFITSCSDMNCPQEEFFVSFFATLFPQASNIQYE